MLKALMALKKDKEAKEMAALENDITYHIIETAKWRLMAKH